MEAYQQKNLLCIPGDIWVLYQIDTSVDADGCLAQFHEQIAEQVLVTSILLYLYHKLMYIF